MRNGKPLLEVLAVSAAVALSLTISSAAAWTLIDLGLLPGTTVSVAFDINDKGQVVGHAYGPSQERPFIWSSNSALQELPILPRGTLGRAEAINARGDVAGYSEDYATLRGVVWKDGISVQNLGALPHAHSVVHDINSLGQAVGLCFAESDPTSEDRACLWTSGGEIQVLGLLPGGHRSEAFRINDSGQVLGHTVFPSGTKRAFLWSSTSGMQDFATLVGEADAVVHDINNAGQVVGSSGGRAFVWSAAGGVRELPSLPGKFDSSAFLINDNGEIVGATGSRLVVWSGESIIDLSGAVAGWSVLSLTAINNLGQIVGSGRVNRQERAFLLSPGGQRPSPKTAGRCPAAGQGAGQDPDRPQDCPLGNPVHPATGNKYQLETDYAGSGVYPLRFERFYNSIAGSGSGSIGAQWRHTFDRSVQRVGTTAVAHRPDGKAYVFAQIGANWVGPPDVMDSLAQTQSGWTYTTAPHDEVETYSSDGRLSSIADRTGISHILGYDASKRLVTVTHSVTGAALAFSYDASSRIAAMKDAGGSAYAYTYDRGRLSSVAYPDDTVSVADNPARTYTYNEPEHTSNTYLPQWLTGIIDENGNRFATFKYDADGRAVSTEHAGGTDKYTVSYGTDGTSAVTDPLNTVRTYAFQTRHEVPRAGGVDKPCDYCGLASAISYDASGFLESVTDFNGFQTRYVHNARGLEETRTEASGSLQARIVTTQWHQRFRLPVAIAEAKRITTYQYDATTSRVLSKTVQATTDQDGSAGFSATPTGTPRVWSYSYQPAGTAGPVESMTVDGPRTETNDLTRWQFYPSDHACTPSLTDSSAAGCRAQLRTITNALGHHTEITRYNAHGQPEEIIDPNGLVITLGYDRRQRVTSRSAGGETTYYEYWPTGLVKRVSFPDQTFLEFAYDDAHRLTGVTDTAGSKIRYTLDAMGNRVREETVDPGGAFVRGWQGKYDQLNRLIESIGGTNPLTQITQYRYDAQANLTSITDPLLRVARYEYDAHNRLTKAVAPQSPGSGQGGSASYEYDHRDQLRSVTDPRGLTTTYQRDGLDNLSRLTSPDTGTTNNAYDEAGNLVSGTDARGVLATYTYDALNRLTQAVFTPPSGSTLATLTHTYEYDQGANGIGRLTRMTDPTGTTGFAYDAHGRIIQDTRVIAGVSYTTAYRYDSAGRLTGMTYPSGRRVDYTLDSLGRISAVTTTRGATTHLVLAAVSYRPFGEVQSFVFGNGQPYTRSFDLDGRITATTLGERTQALTWDAANRITALADAADPANATQLGYDQLDRLVSFITPSTSQGFSYDAVGNRLTQTIGANTYGYTYPATSNRLAGASGPAPLAYSYDAAGNPATNGKHIFLHDARGRLTQVVNAGNGALLAHYQVNALGQRVHKNPGSGPGRVFLYDAAGRLIGEAGPAGQPLWDHIWLGDLPVAWVSADQDEDGVADEADNCITVANPSQRDLDGDGIGDRCHGDMNGDGKIEKEDAMLIQRCIVRLQPCNPKEPKYDLNENGRLDAADALLVAYRIGLPPGPSGVRGEAANAQMFYVYPDHLNSPRLISDGQNRVRWRWDNTDPFGANMASEDPDADRIKLAYPLRFPGQYFDKETGLHYNYFRDYDPSTGRYLQTDPIGLRAGTNPYVYARGNPGIATDPLGLFPIETIWDVGNIIYDIITGSWGDLAVDSIAAATPYVPAGLSKLRKIPQATKCVADASNYRKLFKESRPDLPDDWVIHHGIPQRYEELFRVADINIHDLQFLRGVDPRLHSKITGEWEAFHRGMGRDPTAAQVAEFAKQIDTKYGEKFVWPGK